MPGGGGNFRASGAFANADSGWLEGPVEISTKTPPPAPLQPWPVSLRAPLSDVTGAPGAPTGSLELGRARGRRRRLRRPLRARVAAGSASSCSPRAAPSTRRTCAASPGPKPARAHAVGDLGAMWQWNAADDLWVADPGVPIGFEGNLMDVAFDPGDPGPRLRGRQERGPARLRQELGPGWRCRPAYESANLTSIAFAGSQAIVAAGRRPAGQRRRCLARRRIRPGAARSRPRAAIP